MSIIIKYKYKQTHTAPEQPQLHTENNSYCTPKNAKINGYYKQSLEPSLLFLEFVQFKMQP